MRKIAAPCEVTAEAEAWALQRGARAIAVSLGRLRRQQVFGVPVAVTPRNAYLEGYEAAADMLAERASAILRLPHRKRRRGLPTPDPRQLDWTAEVA
jgi:hypothetical protein